MTPYSSDSSEPEFDLPGDEPGRGHEWRTRTGDRPHARYAEPREESRGSISTGRWMWEGLKAVSTAIVLFLLIRTFVVEAFKIPTGSMENTLLVGDFLLVNKAVYGAEIPITQRRLPAFAEPEREDVVVFLPPHEPDKNYVKRIVGMPGDTLEMRGKVLFLNGVPHGGAVRPLRRSLHRPHGSDACSGSWSIWSVVASTSGGYRPTRDNWGPIVVPEGKFFALGDNRDRSEDSRYWGFLRRERHQGPSDLRLLLLRAEPAAAVLLAHGRALVPHRGADPLIPAPVRGAGAANRHAGGPLTA